MLKAEGFHRRPGYGGQERLKSAKRDGLFSHERTHRTQKKGGGLTRIGAKGPVFAQMLRPGTREFDKTLTTDGSAFAWPTADRHGILTADDADGRRWARMKILKYEIGYFEQQGNEGNADGIKDRKNNREIRETNFWPRKCTKERRGLTRIITN